MYVLKNPLYPNKFPPLVYETTYTESEIPVKQGIAVVQNVDSKEALFHRGYDYVGEIQHMDQLEALLNGATAVPEKKELPQVETSTVIQEPKVEAPEVQPEGDYWWQKG